MGYIKVSLYNTYLFGGKMKQVSLKNLALFSLLFLLLFSSTISAADQDFDYISKNVNSPFSLAAATPPVFYDTFYVCPGDSIYDTLLYSCWNVTDPQVVFEITSGPGSFTTEIVPTSDSIFGYYAYVPQTEGDISVAYMLVDGRGDTLFYSHNYTVYFNSQQPVIQDQSFSSVACDLTAMRELQIVATDSSASGLTYSLLSGQGSINALTGLLSYQPDTSGIFEFVVAVENGCGADTATVIDSVHLNTPPQVFCYDSLVTLCQVEEICFDVLGVDVDGDPVQI